MKKAWQTIKSTVIHKNPWYILRQDDVVRPDGKKGKYYFVDGIDSVMIIAEDKDEKIFLVGQTRYPIKKKYSWEIIGGGHFRNESPLASAKRELVEEIGFKARSWKKLGSFYPINGYGSEKCSVFLARDLTFVGSKPEVTEDIKIAKKSLKEIIKMIEQEKILCGITIAGLSKYLLYKQNIKI